MKTICIAVLCMLLLCRCSEKESKMLFNGSRPEGVSFQTDNLNIGETAGVFIASGPRAKVTYAPENGLWDLTRYVFIDCQVENLSDRVQLVELMIDVDQWTMGAVYLEPGEKKIVRSVILRQVITEEEKSQFKAMNGYPGGSIHVWLSFERKSYVPDSIKNISLNFPLSEDGDKIKIGRVSAFEELKRFTDEEYKAMIPIIDEYGQYIHKEWLGKIKSVEDIIKADEKELADLEINPGYAEMSKYGGWKNGPRLTATGHFRVEKYNGIWTIIDPEGYLFWSHGMDCVTPSYSTSVGGREQLFKYIPDAQGEFSDFVRPPGGRTPDNPASSGSANNTIGSVNFHGMNLKRKWGEDYKNMFNKRTIQRLKSWGINTIANWSDATIYNMNEIPYTINAGSSIGRMQGDPFNPGFQQQIEDQITGGNSKAIEDPWCLGIFIDNEIHWVSQDLLGNNILTTESYPFTKLAMLDTLKKKYVTISALNIVWGSNFNTWNDVTKNTNKFEGVSDDLKMISGLFANEYYKKCRAAVKKVAPDMMYLGSRFDFHFYPEADLAGRDWVIPYSGKYADIVSFNRYTYHCSTMKPVNKMDFPIIIGEFHFGALDRGLPHSGLRNTTNQTERALVYKNYVMQAVENPYVVGVGWFQYLDQPYTGRGDGENYQIGFITVGDYPNQEIVESAREVGENMYKKRYGDL